MSRNVRLLFMITAFVHVVSAMIANGVGGFVSAVTTLMMLHMLYGYRKNNDSNS